MKDHKEKVTNHFQGLGGLTRSLRNPRNGHTFALGLFWHLFLPFPLMRLAFECMIERKTPKKN